MVVYCCAFGCKERHVKGGPISFHGFPRDTDRRKRWILNIRREGFKPTENSRICSKHFTDDCFDREKFGAHLLKKNAVPTIFNFPIHLQIKQTERKTENSSVWEDQSEPNSSDPRLSSKVCENQRDQSEPSTSSSNPRLNSNVCENQRDQSEPNTSSSNTRLNSRVCENQTEPSTSSCYARLKRKLFLGDFEEEDMQSPTQAVKLLKVARTADKLHLSKIKYLSQRKRRLEKKVCSLQEVLKIMRKKFLISQAASNMLEMEWTNDMTMEFLDLLEGEPIIWDPKHPDHKERYVSRDAWKRIQEAFSLDCTIKELKMKKENLMKSYRRLASKVRTAIEKDEMYKPEYFAFEKISSFMQGIYIPKKNRSSEILEDDENETVLSNKTTFSDRTMPNETITPDCSGTSNGFSQPQSTGPPKVKKRKNETSEAEESREAASKVSQIIDEKLKKDESSAFCELLCIQLREMDTDMRQIAMHEINSLILHLRGGQGKTLDSCDDPNFPPLTGYFED